MKLVFIGSTQFGLRCLQSIFTLPQIEVVGIITNSETFSISYSSQGVKNVLHANFSAIAKQQKIPLTVMEGKMTDEVIVESVKAWSPDLLLVVGWYHMVPKIIRDIAPAIGLHASLLPDYSGGAPLVWAIINGEEKTGISLFKLDDGVDNGDIIAQAVEPILFEDTIATLYERIELSGLRLLEEYLPKLAAGTAILKKQDEKSRRIMPQRSPKDGKINWGWSALQIYNFVRAQTKPYPGAFTYIQGKKLFIWAAKLFDLNETTSMQEKSYHPGEIIGLYKEGKVQGFLVAAGNSSKILVTEVGGDNDETLSAEIFVLSENVNNSIILGEGV